MTSYIQVTSQFPQKLTWRQGLKQRHWDSGKRVQKGHGEDNKRCSIKPAATASGHLKLKPVGSPKKWGTPYLRVIPQWDLYTSP